MWFVAAGVLAAAISWFVSSRLVIPRFHLGRVWVSPMLEEALKTGLALSLGAQVVLCHAVFGAVESIYEIWWKKKTAAGGAAFVSHLLFGIVTVELYRWWGVWPLAIIGAAAVHTTWNGLVFLVFPGHKID
ncbi:MAG: hypothetical protein HPY50_17855 [Firmicutes bacterium]|nr:hypothetical protein [Bacillota bacterium]